MDCNNEYNERKKGGLVVVAVSSLLFFPHHHGSKCLYVCLTVLLISYNMYIHCQLQNRIIRVIFQMIEKTKQKERSYSK